LVLLVLLAGAVFFYFRPIQPGDLAALAENWNMPAASAQNPQSAPDANPDDFNRFGPQRPTATARPAAWPTDRVPGDGGRGMGDGRREPLASDPGTPCEGAEILARVGNDVILARELSMGIAEIRANNKDKPASVLEPAIREILKKRLEPRVEEKLVCQDAQRKIPKEHFTKILNSFDADYEKKMLPELMKNANVGSRRELEQKLRDAGISLEIYKRAYIEGILAHEWLKAEIKVDEEISYDQIEAYYREHAAEFIVHPPLARWEQLMVRTSSFPSGEAAHAALAEMGNQVLDGASLAEVAKARSQGSTADKGGLHDWTDEHNLASKVLDEAIFTLPIGRLSPILEDEQGFHIVRVLQRQPIAMKPFDDAQVDIKKKIKAQRKVDAKNRFVAKIREQTAVWTAFDNDRGPATAQFDGLFR
jgi:uncharacterized protein YeeX (DUF496 family)